MPPASRPQGCDSSSDCGTASRSPDRRSNSACGRPGTTREEIVEAAQAMCVDRFVCSLPDGCDTLLDEAKSSVDTRTEVLIQQAMAAKGFYVRL